MLAPPFTIVISVITAIAIIDDFSVVHVSVGVGVDPDLGCVYAGAEEGVSIKFLTSSIS
jgi:hypothetical protein